jgi:hypothetical protein
MSEFVPEITARTDSASRVGWCNACIRTGQDAPHVRVVRLRALEFRLCPDCATHLTGMLTELAKRRSVNSPYTKEAAP